MKTTVSAGWYYAGAALIIAFFVYPAYYQLEGIAAVLLFFAYRSARHEALHGGPPIWYCHDEERAIEEGTPSYTNCVAKQHDMLCIGKNYADAHQRMQALKARLP